MESRPNRMRFLFPLVLAMAGCGEGRAPPADPAVDVATAPAARLAPVSQDTGPQRLVALPDRAPRAGADRSGAMPGGRWFLLERDPPQAAWGAPASEFVLSFSCDREGRRIVLEREAIGLSPDVRVLTIEADGTRVDYPVERMENTLGPHLVTQIALDAAILDRLLTARSVAVVADGDRLVATSPAAALGPVVEACRTAY